MNTYQQPICGAGLALFVTISLFLTPSVHAEFLRRTISIPQRIYSVCENLLRSDQFAPSPSDSFRMKIWQYKLEVQSQRGILPFGSWERRSTLRSASVREHLTRMNLELSKLLSREIQHEHSPIVNLASAQTLQSFTAKAILNFDKKGISYSDFVHLALLHAAQTSYLIGRANDIPSIFYPTSFPEVELFLKINEFEIGGTEFFNLTYLDQDKNLIVAFPTYAKLGFKTLLWAQSRGIGFLQQATTSEMIDGSEHPPLRNLIHDFGHNWIFSGTKQDPLFWDRIETLIEASHTTREKEIKYGLAFSMFHESGIDMSCEGVYQHSHLRGNPGDPRRLLDAETDLGQSFKTRLSESELQTSIEKFKLDLAAACI